ncbi:hypothetical protein [Larkinella knui]|uniref:PorT family protein n=1 Tax=Larkinella knui TaxID=2025310 RepID=A0A3P1CE79_9BACT|nr:hypothetical protein [Larkinella knui]RRB11653.1 hypothetical protein EHT87_24610 [Larkinella knui]
MKKLFFSALLLTVFSLNLHAQIQVGVRGGTYWSTLRGRSAVRDGSLGPGFVVGIPIQLSLTGHWHIRLDPSVIQKGWQSKVDYTTALGQPAGTGKWCNSMKWLNFHC